ncbi:hypothetical protein Tco_0700139 [Tanacetum coccineum]
MDPTIRLRCESGSEDGLSITGSADGLLGSSRGPYEIGFYYGPLLTGWVGDALETWRVAVLLPVGWCQPFTSFPCTFPMLIRQVAYTWHHPSIDLLLLIPHLRVAFFVLTVFEIQVFPISVPLYTGGALEKDPAPHLTARQEQTVQVLSANKAPFRRYPECFLVLVGLSLYYPFDENNYPAFERPDKIDIGLLDYIRTADPRKVQAVEVQKGEEQVKLLDSIKHCFVSLDALAVVQQEGCSGSGAGPDVSAPSAEENVVTEESVIPAGTYLDLMDPEGDLTVVEKGDAARKQPDKVKRKKLSKQSDTLPAKKLRVDHPSLASGTGGKSLASLRRTIPEGSLALGPSSQADVHAKITVQGSHVADAPVYTTADTVTSSRGKMHAASMSDMGESSQLETSKGLTDSFYKTAALNSKDAKRWYIPR